MEDGKLRPREPETYTVPAERELTIRDLMTHTNGLETGENAVMQAIIE